MTIKTTDPIAVAQTVAEFYSRNGVHGEALAEIYNATSEIAHQVVSENPKIDYSQALKMVEQRRGGEKSSLSKYLRFKDGEAMRETVVKHFKQELENFNKDFVDTEKIFYSRTNIYETRDLDGDSQGDYIVEKRFPNLGKWGTRVFNLTLTSGQKTEEGLITKDGDKIRAGDSVALKAVGSSQPLSGIVKEFSPRNITFATDHSGEVIGSGVMATVVLEDGSEVIRSLDDLYLVSQ